MSTHTGRSVEQPNTRKEERFVQTEFAAGRFEPSLLIDGKLVQARSGRTFADVDPYRETVIVHVPDAGVEDVEDAVNSAQRAFARTGWAQDHQLRGRCLRQLQDALQRHIEDLREILIAEVGCPIKMTRAVQLDMPVAELSDSAVLAETYPFARELAPHASMVPASARLLIREPWGVAGLITPYNYPIQQLCYKVGPALAAGNTVVLKPSPLTPLSSLLVARLVAEETEIPAGVLNIITSADPAVGKALVSHPDVQMIHFTGSTPVGKQIMVSAAAGVKKVALELGGKSANIVLDDADIEAVTRFNVERMARHSGQACTNLTRLVVPKTLYGEALEVAADHAPQVRWGDPRDPETHMGPQISRDNQQRVLRFIETGLTEGGRLIAGGGVPAASHTGYFVEATVIGDVGPDSTIAQEEIFGPVLAVIPYETDDEAIEIANNSAFGLSGAVWSASDTRALSVAKRVRTGTMDVNGATWFAPDSPFGGMKQSGLGREWGVTGFEEFLDTRVIGYPMPSQSITNYRP